MGVRKGAKRAFAEIDTKNKLSRKPEFSTLIPINCFNSCIGNLFAVMTLTLHNSQVHYSGCMQ